MGDITTAAAASAVAAGNAAALSGKPTSEVIAWALAGGLVSVWLSRQAEVKLSVKWLASAVMQIGVSAAAGIVFSALLLAGAPAFAWSAPLANAPRWAIAAVIAAVAIKAGPLVWAWATSRRTAGAATKEGGTHDVQ